MEMEMLTMVKNTVNNSISANYYIDAQCDDHETKTKNKDDRSYRQEHSIAVPGEAEVADHRGERHEEGGGREEATHVRLRHTQLGDLREHQLLVRVLNVVAEVQQHREQLSTTMMMDKVRTLKVSVFVLSSLPTNAYHVERQEGVHHIAKEFDVIQPSRDGGSSGGRRRLAAYARSGVGASSIEAIVAHLEVSEVFAHFRLVLDAERLHLWLGAAIAAARTRRCCGVSIVCFVGGGGGGRRGLHHLLRQWIGDASIVDGGRRH